MRTEVFVDFDGTITDLDTFDVLVRDLAGDDAWDAFETGLDGGRYTLRDVMAAEAALVRVPFEEGAALLDRRVAFDGTFADFVALCARREYGLTVVSSGAKQIIERRFAREGLPPSIVVHANDIDASDYANGWRFKFRDASENAGNKEALVRAASARGSRTIFIGDGRSDYAAAIAADRRFVKRGRKLEEYLRARGVAFEAFDTFAQIARALDATAA